jgi:hypothetical protein
MKLLEVERQGGVYPADAVREVFRRYGVVVLRRFMPEHTRDDLRNLLEKTLADADRRGAVLRLPIYPKADYLLGDLLSIRELERYDFIFLKPELLELLRALLGSRDLLYFGDSSVQFGEAGRGFHKDNVDRYDGAKDDWQSDYGLIRCAFYMQDHVTHSGGLKVRLASHNIPTHTKGKMADVASRYGDLVLWSMRLTHSGNNKKVRFPPSIVLHPRLEMMLPAALTAPEQLRRISAFCAFGRQGSHADLYIDNLDVRAADYKAYLQRARKRDEAERILARVGVSLKMPHAYYGELD